MNRKGKRGKFAEMIRATRLEKSLSQRDLGEQIGVWNTYVGQIEKGEKVPSDEKVEKLAEVLELDVTELLVAAYGARAETEEAREIFRKMEQALTDPVIQALLSTSTPLDPGILIALADEDIRGALCEESWRALLASSYKIKGQRDIPALLALVTAMSEKQWMALMSILGTMDIVDGR